VGDDSHVVFGQKFAGKKRKCEMARSCDATASSLLPKFGLKSSNIFAQSL
jgi:hypothetical protein